MRSAIAAAIAVVLTGSMGCMSDSSNTRPSAASPQPAPTTTTSAPVTASTSVLGTSGSAEVDADLDGDGRPDHFSISAPDPAPDRYNGRTMDVVLSNGTTDHESFGGADQLVLFPVDIDHDGRNEVLVRTGGNTWTTGALVVFTDRLQVVSFAENGNQFFGWTAHSNCCPGGTADIACLTVDGQASLVVTSSQYVPDDWNGSYPVPLDPDVYTTDRRRAWTRTVYHLQGASLVATLHDTGVVAHDAPGPPGVPLDNRLACGTVNDQGG